MPTQPDPLTPQDLDLPAFEELLDTIVSLFDVIPIERAAAALRNNKLPSRAACLTFDDGYSSWIDGVVPLLHKRNLHATFYITTGQFSDRPLWHERIMNVVRRCKTDFLRTNHAAILPLPMNTMQQRTTAVYYLEKCFKYLTLNARNEILAEMEKSVGTSTDEVSVMSMADLRTIHSMGFSIGAHTNDHPILQYCDESTALEEIGQARERLSHIIGGDVTSFAYPNGLPFSDYSSKHVQLVKQAGYSSAVTTQWGVATPAVTSPFQIPRFTPWGNKELRMVWQLGRNLLTRPHCVDEC